MNKTLKTLSLFCMMGGSALAQNITGNYQIPKVPAWAENAVFYQIYPQTFCDSDGDGNQRTDKELEIIYAFGFTMPGTSYSIVKLL